MTAAPVRVLAVEDERDDIELIGEMLASDGIQASILRVDSSPTLEFALTNNEFDLVLIDYVMPRFDGVRAMQVCRRLRPNIPIVFMTGAVDEHVAAELASLGADDFVMKARLEDLPAIVRRLTR
jgi:CheY-like chemotaxis protein